MTDDEKDEQGEGRKLRRRAVELLEHNLRRVETTPRRPLDPNLLRTEADQAVVNVSAAFEALDALGLMTEADRERFYRRLREITSTSYEPFRGVELKRVVRSQTARDAPGLHLLGAELYADGVILRWVFVSPSAQADRAPAGHRPPEAFALWDDAGTAYTPQGGGWIPGHHLRGDTAFVPAVPPRATRLEVGAGKERYQLELRPG